MGSPFPPMTRFARLFLIFLLLVTAAEAVAQTGESAVITEIEVVGALTVGSRQVHSWAELQTGQPLTSDLVSNAIRKLFATQKFSDVFIYRQDEVDGVRLIINLQEFPRIRSVTFAGNDNIKESDLRAEFTVHVGQFANPAVVRRELQPLRELYYEKGYYNVVIHRDQSRVDANNMEDLIVTVDEGQKVKVQTITFVGNDNLSESDLKGAMEQGTKGFLRKGVFKKAQFEADSERIVTLARNHGYLDAAVTDVGLEFQTEDPEKLDIVITIAEGKQYFVGDINWTGNTVFDDIAIANQIWLQNGDVFEEDAYLEALANLQQIYADRGYIYITVEPERDIVDQTVNVAFTFIEGQPAKIHDIEISGNAKTYDNVILREMRIFPGDPFSNTRIQSTLRDIFQTGFFEDVQPDIRPVANGDVDMILKVKEKQTGQFMFGMAYSAETSVSGFIQVAETNFRGKGQNIGLTWQFGSRRRYMDLSFTEPWFMGTPTLIGGDLFDRYQYNLDDFYESRVRGFSLRLGRRVPGTRYSRVGLRYELSETRLKNFKDSYKDYVAGLENSLGTNDLDWTPLTEVDWPQLKSSIRLSFNRNSTDNPFFPTAGSKSSYSFELAGGPLGGEIEFQEHVLSHSTYQRLPGGFALHMRGFLGLLHGINSPNSVPDWERYRLGGNRRYPLRGYRDLEVVPDGNPSFIGGRYFTILNAEILYPLTKAVQLLSFLDMGDVWNSFSEADVANLRKGAGFGIRVEVPMMGTIGFDYGYGFDRLDGSPRWEPHFNIGNFF